MNALQRDLKRLVPMVEAAGAARVAADPHRQKLHVQPPVGWLNDPNGLCQIGDEYHVFYQYGPFDPTGGVKHWGHMRSRDLFHWERLPVMLYPDEPFDCHGVYSGSALVEDGTLYLYYTGNVKHPGEYDYIKQGRGHNVCLATSRDAIHLDNKRCLMYNQDYPAGLTCHVRDPKVFALDGRYYMVLGARTLDDHGEVLVFESADKLHWNHINTITTPKAFGYMWECPDLFELNGQTLGRCVPLATLPACAELVPQLVLPGVQGVGLAVLKTPLMNCVDGSTDAVSIYAPAAGLLHALARCEEQLNAEFANGASRVFASEDLLRPDAQGRRALQDDLFVGLPDDPANVGVTVYSPTLREGSYLARKQDLLRGCESLLGLRRGILSEVETPAEPRTATEIAATSVDYDLTIRDLQSAWTDTVQQAMALCSALGAVYGLDGLPQTAAPAIDWGDGVLYDRARIWAEQRELVDAGLLRPELALAWYFDLPHETEAELAEIRRRFMGDAGRPQ